MASKNPFYVHVVFENAKSHCIPTDLADAIIGDLTSRPGGLPVSVKTRQDTSIHCIDLGGMCAIDEPHDRFRLPSLVIDIMCSHVSGVLDELKRLQPRTLDDGRQFYKIHGQWQCLVLHPEQFDRLIHNLEARASKSDAKAHDWFTNKFPSTPNIQAKIV